LTVASWQLAVALSFALYALSLKRSIKMPHCNKLITNVLHFICQSKMFGNVQKVYVERGTLNA